MTLQVFTAHVDQTHKSLAEISKDHPTWEVVKGSDGFFYLYDARDRCMGFVSFATGKVTLHVKQPSQARLVNE